MPYMLLTLGLTGMDQATEAALRTSFTDANERHGLWMLQNEAEADYVVVDMDSMYGPMSWLRLHAAGKRVIGLTTAPRTQADYRLGRPFDTPALQGLLLRIAQEAGAHVDGRHADGARLESSPETRAPAPPAPRFDAPPALSAAADVRPIAPAATQAALATTAFPTPDAMPAAASAPAPAPFPAATPSPAFPPAAAPLASPSPASPSPAFSAQAADAWAPEQDDAASAARGSGFADWLRPGALAGRARYQSGKGPMLLIDFGLRQYFGPATLKPLAEYFVGAVGLRDFEQLDAAGWDAALGAMAATPGGGAPQPLTRLQWFGALLAGEGRLLPGFAADGKFQLNKWPQTEREYPRHFRIATAMMKGPMTIAEIVTASGVPAGDVVDFINANLTTGFAEPVGAPPDAPDPNAGGKGSLLGRLRGR
ncbi:MAG: hypothetical protein E6Q50_10745 [Lysobacter sp.]|nr:MAG: hypothetical protein E6Q50_10745 [Lysobacter sp.]